MKKKIVSMLLACCMVMTMAACGNDGGNAGTDTPSTQQKSSEAPAASDSGEESKEPASADPTNGEVVDGKFVTTRKITVEIYDRGNDGGSDVTNNVYTNFIKEGMLRDHNVEVEFVSVPRWTEVEQINNLLAAGDAPDVCVTYDYPTILTYANMGGVLDLSPYLTDEYKPLLSNLWEWPGEENLMWNKDPANGTIWAIEARLATLNRINTFVRKDWLDKLNIKEPTTKQEFEDMLIAFRDNAELLLGDDADKMIPYGMTFDVGWQAGTLIESFLDPDMSDKEFYVNGFDDRKFTQNGTKEAVRLLNKWYNDGLIWKDFALYQAGDTTADNMMKAGYVGAFTHNWDYPYRNGEDSIQSNIQRLAGEDAAYVVVDPFEDSKGTHTKFVSAPIDRKVFFPATNDEPLASLMYLDWISTPENLEFLQIGEEGVTHKKLDDGAIEVIAVTGEAIQNSPFNIDYTITNNGLNLVDEEQTLLSTAHSYSGIDPELIEIADKIAKTDIRPGKNVNVGAIAAEEGMGTALSDKRNIVFDTAVTASAADFDKVWDSGMADYLSSGGQAIIDERTAKWEATFGGTDMLPE